MLVIDYKNQGRIVTLFGHDLYSKFGFSDGDLLHEILFDNELADRNDHCVLEVLVKQYLLPALPSPVEIQFIPTCHNPVRVKDYFDAQRETLAHYALNVDVAVEVTEEQICAAARELPASSDE